MKFPPTIGAAVDLMHELDQERAKRQARVDAVKGSLLELEWHVFRLLAAENLESGRGKRAQATVSKREHPKVDDWSAFERYVYKNKALDLLQKRVSSTAWKARRDAGKAVAGVGVYEEKVLHVTKVKKVKIRPGQIAASTRRLVRGEAAGSGSGNAAVRHTPAKVYQRNNQGE